MFTIFCHFYKFVRIHQYNHLIKLISLILRPQLITIKSDILKEKIYQSTQMIVQIIIFVK